MVFEIQTYTFIHIFLLYPVAVFVANTIFHKKLIKHLPVHSTLIHIFIPSFIHSFIHSFVS